MSAVRPNNTFKSSPLVTRTSRLVNLATWSTPLHGSA